MSVKTYTKAQMRWFYAGYSIIAQKYEQQLASPQYEELVDELMDDSDKHWIEGEVSESKATKREKAARKEFLWDLERRNNRRSKAKWRLGVNYYKAGKYLEASPLLELICGGGENGKRERELRAIKRQREDEERKELAKKGLKLPKDIEAEREREKEKEKQKLKEKPSTAGNKEETLHQKKRRMKKEKKKDFGPSNEDKLQAKLAAMTPEERNKFETLDTRSDPHLIAARNSKFLYYETKLHYHLQTGYDHYNNAINFMGADLSAFIRLPKVLFEFGSLLENYGAMSAALEVYGKILSNFPNFIGYFDTMYRCGVVGKHLSDVVEDPKEKEDMLNKCIDIFQFLLEAVPPTIQETHLVLLYAKALDMHGDAGVRFRAQEAYGALWNLCRDMKPVIANADKFKTYKEWCADPNTWYLLADMMAGSNEPLVARNGFDLFQMKVEDYAGMGKEVEGMKPEMWLRCAQNSSAFQDFDKAVEFGAKALAVNRLHGETRAFLSQNSEAHRAIFLKEKSAARFLSKQWLERCFSLGYIAKVKNKMIEDLEEKLESSQYDPKIREDLAYYAKGRWRAKFLFESESAMKIQNCFKVAKARWKWQLPIRTKYLEIATTAYRAFMKDPLNADYRKEVWRVYRHKFCSKKHIIRKVIPILERQANAIISIRRAYKAFSLRIRISRAVAKAREERNLAYLRRVIMVQNAGRKLLAKSALVKQRKRRELRIKMALKINKFVYHFFQIYMNSPKRLVSMEKARINDAARCLQIVFRYIVKKFIQRRINAQLAEEKRLADEAEAHRLYLLHRYTTDCANRIQRIVHRYLSRLYHSTYRTAIVRRRTLGVSSSAYNTMKLVNIDNLAHYSPPGVRQTTEKFLNALQQTTMYCNEDFSSTDCLMLSALIRHRSCRINKIIFDQVDGCNPNYEFDLLPSLNNNKSVKQISLTGGKWSENFISGLIKLVQVDNPAITDLSLENIPINHVYRQQFISQMGILWHDYFNYSAPGIAHVSLHGMKLIDRHVSLLIDGLKVNTSLTSIELSGNCIEDNGLYAIVEAINSNEKCRITNLDMSFNLITLNKKIRQQLWLYRPLNVLTILKISLLHNPILFDYDPCPKNYQNLVIISSGRASNQSSSTKSVSVKSPHLTRSNMANFKLVNNISSLRSMSAENPSLAPLKVSKVTSRN